MLALGLAVGLALAALIAWLRAAWRRGARSRVARGRAARAIAGEGAAEALLADAGYEVIARQAHRTWELRCDGAPIAIELRCDLLATADGKTFVAEVKTGAAAPRLDTAATRRQLLEYQVAYGADGVLLVDAEAGAVRVVDFPLAPARGDGADDAGAPEDAGADGTGAAAAITWLAIAAAAAVGFAAGRLW